MQNLGLVLLAFSFVCFLLATLPMGRPNWQPLVSAGLALMVAADLFGGLAALHYFGR